MRVTEFWPWRTRHQMRFFADDGGVGGGDGGSDGGDAVAEAPEWMGDFAYFDGNEDAVKHFSKYKTAEDAWRGTHETIKTMGAPFRLPKDHSKLSDEQRAELDGYYAKTRGVPDSAEGYEFKLPEGVAVDEKGLADFRQFCFDTKMPPEQGQRTLDFHFGLVEAMKKARDAQIQGMTHQSYQAFLNDDCGGDADLAGTRMEMTKRYLQSFCVDKDGKPDADQWERYAARKMVGDRFIELIDLRALHEAARIKAGTGGSPGGEFGQAAAKDAFGYKEMDGKKK